MREKRLKSRLNLFLWLCHGSGMDLLVSVLLKNDEIGVNFRAVPFLFHYRETSSEFYFALIVINSVAVVMIISGKRMMFIYALSDLIRSFVSLIHY